MMSFASSRSLLASAALLLVVLLPVACGEVGPGDGAGGAGVDSGDSGSGANSGDGDPGSGNGGVGANSGTGGGGFTLPDGPRVATIPPPLELLPAPGLAGPALKVDLDIEGRPTSEVTEPGYLAWVVTEGASLSKTIEGVSFTFQKAGSVGTALDGDWLKVAVQSPNFARLAGDGLTVANGDAGSQIQLTLTDLPGGRHSLLAWHNVLGSNAIGKVDVLVNGTSQVTGLSQSKAVLSNADAPTSYVTFTVESGEDVVILYRSTGALMINGFELDTPNLAEQATSPTPGDWDEHVDADTGSVVLGWTPAEGAVSHDVYFGLDPNLVQSATRESREFQSNQALAKFPLAGLSSIDHYYWRIDEIDSGGNVTRGNVWYFRPRHLAFPGAGGYGRFAIGGRGGPVVHVTNLNDSGAGSLRAAVEGDLGPRTIVFDVAGEIRLASRLTLSSRYVTIAGQTAPGKGIVITKAPFGFSGTTDSSMRHVRVRVGYGTTYDGIGLQGADHCIFDHNSVSWSIDEAFSSRNARNITLQNTLVSEALNSADHQNYPSGTKHGYAGTISGNVGSFHHNLLAHCEGRNFSMGSAIDGAGTFVSRLDLFNNVVYNFGGRANDGQVHQANFFNNYYKKGPATTINFTFSMDLENYGTGTISAYYEGNILQNTNGSFACDGTNSECGRRYTLSNGNPEPTWEVFQDDEPFFASDAPIHSAKDALKIVLSDVGANQPLLDEHDVRVVKETLKGTTTYKGSKTNIAGLPDRESDVGGLESFPKTSREAGWDTDGDGLPNFWEQVAGTNPSSPEGDFTDANTDLEGDGDTELEEYLAFLGAPHFIVEGNAPVTLDLPKFYAGFDKSPTYSSPDAEGGTATISGSTVTFTPSGCGLLRFSVQVADSEGTTMVRDVFVFAVPAGGSCQ